MTTSRIYLTDLNGDSWCKNREDGKWEPYELTDCSGQVVDFENCVPTASDFDNAPILEQPTEYEPMTAYDCARLKYGELSSS